MRFSRDSLAAVAASICLAAPAAASAELTPELLGELQPIVETGLASEDVAVQSWAVRAAALIGDAAFVDAITGALANANPPVRLAAAQALIRAGVSVPEARQVLVTEMLEGDAATRGLVMNNILLHLGEDTRIGVLDAVLSQAADAGVLREVVAHIAQRGEGAVHALLERSGGIEDGETRAVYVAEVIRAARPEGVAVAGALLASSDAATRLEGAEVAFAINTVEARALLEPLLDSPDAALAQRVGFHLARYGNARALSRAAELARNTEMPEDLRMSALALLRDNGPQLLSWDELRAMIAEEGRSVAFQTRVYEAAGATRDSAALQAIRAKLDGLFADERLFGISGYGYSGQVDAVDTFREIVSGSGDLALRLRAAEALGNIGGDYAAQALVDALRAERVDEVKVAIVSALGHTGSALAPQAIANTFALQNDAISLAAIEALAVLGDATVAHQVENAAIGARSPAVRWEATVLLTLLDPALGRIRLLQALDRPPEGFLDDIATLPPAVQDEVDVRLLQHSDQRIRETALFRVMRAEDRGYSVLRPLVQSATSPDVRRQAIAVVTARAGADDAEVFEALASDTDRSIRLQGFAALASLGDPANEEQFRGYLNHADVALRMIATFGLLEIHN